MVDFKKAKALKNNTHVMVDLETLGTKPGCMLLSIGAVRFDPKGDPNDPNTISGEFYHNIKLDEQHAGGLTMSHQTVGWWLKQSDKARAMLLYDKIPLGETMRNFEGYFIEENSQAIWSHGMNFDIPIIDHCMELCGIKPPWGWTRIRDTRTIFDMADSWPDRSKGIYHYALDDAFNQARAVQMAYFNLKTDK